MLFVLVTLVSGLDMVVDMHLVLLTARGRSRRSGEDHHPDPDPNGPSVTTCATAGLAAMFRVSRSHAGRVCERLHELVSLIFAWNTYKFLLRAGEV